MKEYIEREAALELIDGIYDCNDMVFEKNDSCVGLDCGSCRWRDTKNYIRGRLAHIPAADVVPAVKAKWELDSDKLPICSNCGEIALQRIFVKVPHLIQDVRMVKSNFCPNCGARMDGDGE